METERPDALEGLKKLSLWQKILLGIVVVICFAFVGYMNLAQRTHDQEYFRETYQEYTEKFEGIITEVKRNQHAQGRTSFDTVVTFTTLDGEEMSSLLPDSDFVAQEGSLIEILYNPSTGRILTVKEYEERTGLKVN